MHGFMCALCQGHKIYVVFMCAGYEGTREGDWCYSQPRKSQVLLLHSCSLHTAPRHDVAIKARLRPRLPPGACTDLGRAGVRIQSAPNHSALNFRGLLGEAANASQACCVSARATNQSHHVQRQHTVVVGEGAVVRAPCTGLGNDAAVRLRHWWGNRSSFY